MPQLRHQHRHDLTVLLLEVGGSLLLYILLGIGIAGLFARRWAPVDFANGHWGQWVMASFAIWTSGTVLTFLAAFFLGLPLYAGIFRLVSAPVYRIYEGAGSFGRHAIDLMEWLLWPLALYEAIYTGLSLGYWMR